METIGQERHSTVIDPRSFDLYRATAPPRQPQFGKAENGYVELAHCFVCLKCFYQFHSYS